MPTPHHFKAFASSSNLLLVTKIVTVSSMGIFTGTALCYNAIVMPSLRKFASTSSLAVWSEMFLLTKPIQVSAIAISALGGSILYYKTHDPFYLLGGMMMAIIVPYTKLLFDPMDNRLLDIRKHGKDDRGVEEMLMRWDTLHFGRTLLGYGATVVTLYAALRGH
ncbi:hypothetical protein EDD21DRAFT_241895 [Dissophora ornata]|nr:hypothetical protein BGZ58_000303 [Dissophora ornata]KAI8596627.1 hypothetical protein EDD21DRAFT_241895 [Dissophora ornata]